MKALLRSLVVAALGTTVAAEPATLDDAKPDEAVRRTRPLNALMIGLGGIFAIALLSDQFDGWLRKPARAEAAAPPAAVANGPTFVLRWPRRRTPRLRHHRSRLPLRNDRFRGASAHKRAEPGRTLAGPQVPFFRRTQGPWPAVSASAPGGNLGEVSPDF